MPRKSTGVVLPYEGANDTTYYARFQFQGERHKVILGYASKGMTPDTAQTALDNLMADVRRGIWHPVPPVPVVTAAESDPDFLTFASEWFEAHKLELREESIPAVQWRLEHILLPFFASYRLTQIDVQAVDRYRAEQVRRRERLIKLRDAEAKKPKVDQEKMPRPLSNSTINRTITLLGQILDVAVEYGHMPANPARGKRRKLKTSKPRRSYLDSAAQIVAVLDAAGAVDANARTDRKHLARRAMFSTFVFAGLRMKELRLLRWRNVDLANGRISVANMPDDTDAKTDAGHRKIKIRPVLQDVLSEYRAQTGDSDTNALVFPTATGNPHSASNVRRTMRTICEAASDRLVAEGGVPLPKLTPHALRRTWASLMFAIGEPLTVVIAEGGWADAEVPLTIYGHAMLQDEGEHERLKQLVEGAEMPPVVAQSGTNGTSGNESVPSLSWPENEQTRH